MQCLTKPIVFTLRVAAENIIGSIVKRPYRISIFQMFCLIIRKKMQKLSGVSTKKKGSVCCHNKKSILSADSSVKNQNFKINRNQIGAAESKYVVKKMYAGYIIFSFSYCRHNLNKIMKKFRNSNLYIIRKDCNTINL